MGVRRLLARVRGIGYEFQSVQHAPAPAGASAVSEPLATVSSLRQLVSAYKDPKAVLDG